MKLLNSYMLMQQEYSSWPNIGSFLILLIIMLSDLRSPKSKRTIETVNKSSTAVSLPGIGNTSKYCKTDRKAIKNSYLQTINHISENVEYGDKSTVYLTKQQSKLKQMLKKMNSDTLHMIDLIKPKRNAVKTSKEEMVMIADRQLDNSKRNISMMQLQIQKLEVKYSKIVEHDQQEELVNKIRQIKLDIQSLRNGNLDIKLKIQKGGKQIVKEYADGYDAKLTILENDNNLFEQRLEKLKQDNSRVNQESTKLQIKLREADERIQFHDQQYQKVKQALLSQNLSRNMEATMKQRKYQAETAKKRMDLQNSHLQYKYYKLLKQLEAKKATCEDLSVRQEEILKRIDKSSQEIVHFQAVNERLKRRKEEKNRSVLLFLQKERKNKNQGSDLRQSMVSSNLFASRQQPLPRALSMREPVQTTFNKADELDQTRKWQSQQTQQICQEQAKKSETNIQKLHVQADKIQDNKETIDEIDHTTTQMKQLQQPKIIKIDQFRIKQQQIKNPEHSVLQKSIK